MTNPTGMIYVVDPSPLNWLFVLFNIMEEPVRADRSGRITPNLAKSHRWTDSKTLEIQLHQDVSFHNGKAMRARNIKQSFDEMMRWIAPHPPGTWINHPPESTCHIVNPHTVRFHFPVPDGLAFGKFRAVHIGNAQFWQQLGFGYSTLGTGEGRW